MRNFRAHRRRADRVGDDPDGVVILCPHAVHACEAFVRGVASKISLDFGFPVSKGQDPLRGGEVEVEASRRAGAGTRDTGVWEPRAYLGRDRLRLLALAAPTDRAVRCLTAGA